MGWAVESLHYLWQGAAETQWASRSNFFCTRIKNILGAKAAQMGLPGAGQGRDLHQEGVCGGKVLALHLEDLGDETVRGREMQRSMRIQFPPCPGGTECREQCPHRCQPCWDQLERKMDLKPRCGYLNVGLLACARVRYLVRGGGRPS